MLTDHTHIKYLHFVFLQHVIAITITTNHFDITVQLIFLHWVYYSRKTRPDKQTETTFLNEVLDEDIKETIP